MATTNATTSGLPPDLFDATTIQSLAAVVAILAVAYGASLKALAPTTTSGTLRALFVWHMFDALVHFTLEGSFLYHCFFTSLPVSDLTVRQLAAYQPTPANFLAVAEDRIYGSQAGDDFWSKLWMVYAKADKRWAGPDLTLISLELLTVFVVGPLATWVCYDIAKKNPRYNITMIVLATAELYGGFMTFCPEWLTGNVNLDSSNFIYLWLYLVFFNMLWVFLPLFAIYAAGRDILNAFAVRAAAVQVKKKQK